MLMVIITNDTGLRPLPREIFSIVLGPGAPVQYLIFH